MTALRARTSLSPSTDGKRWSDMIYGTRQPLNLINVLNWVPCGFASRLYRVCMLYYQRCLS